MSLYNIVVSTNESTVVAEYVAEYNCSNSYQSEAKLEQDFIKRLQEQGYEYKLDLSIISAVKLKGLTTISFLIVSGNVFAMNILQIKMRALLKKLEKFK
jgi:hypothetical protein